MQKEKSVRKVASQPATNLRLYEGRWVAMIGPRVVGVGHTPREAWAAARRLRPKEDPILRFVRPSSS